MKTTRLAIVGLGNVGRRLLELIESKRDILRARYELELIVVGAADSTGGVASSNGLNIQTLLKLKRERKGAAVYPQYGRADLNAKNLAASCDADSARTPATPGRATAR